MEISAVADGLADIDVAPQDVAVRDYAIDRARSTVQRTLAEIRELAKPGAPFSAMVKSWIEVFKADVVVSRVAAAAPPGWRPRAINLEDGEPAPESIG